ncbi:hypothetical protein OIDMADRAFT_15946 [Oidiodendron maius Zn]|uniref:TMEM205-like domain-containing protein n=1 Tax=Oidiodendron maius (strain Zn) TaxID=913774 RepID=A0A0C3HXE4_OIDMZ|nr:hypothetical protein OIDMADRAFT_15946 [Oidiodendron maius Zn]
MATLLTALTKLSSYHLLAWGSLLGMQLYQTFVMTKVCYLYLPRPQFTTLQKRIFPLYFGIETALAAATAATYPSGSIWALASHHLNSALLGLTLAMSGLNLLVYGPKTIEAMVHRSHQKTREALRSSTTVTGNSTSEEMHLARRQFSRNHAMSIHLNLIGVISTVVYGVSLSSRMA